MERKLKVLFLCTGNQARSQMAEAILRIGGGGRFDARSAGSKPESAVHPLAARALAEIGIDISGAVPKNMTTLAGERFDYVITLCDDARDACPVFPGHPVSDHWSLPDPAAAEGSGQERLDAFRHVRDEIGMRIARFVAQPSPADDSTHRS